MRETTVRGYFANGKGDAECVVHAKPEWANARGLRAITDEEAALISARWKVDVADTDPLPRMFRSEFINPAASSLVPGMTARLAEHDARVSEVIQQATEAFEAISRSDNSRITALEQQVTKIQDILVNLAERWGKQ